MRIGVIGLGYVGLPLAVLCARKGMDVVGIDIDAKRVASVKNGKNHLDGSDLGASIEASADYASLENAQTVLICVPTPIDGEKRRDLRPIRSACISLRPYLKDAVVVCIESTVNPFAIEKELLPLLEKDGAREGSDFHLSHCPERIDPGNQKWDVENIPRVFGARSDEGAQRTERFYKAILTGSLKRMSSIAATEAVKMVENAFRDLNIAFVNELAMAFDAMELPLREIIGGAATKPFAFMPHQPGCGVGGHCIPVDPYYLIQEAKRQGARLPLMELARSVNESMPAYAVRLLEKSMGPLKGRKVLVMGLAYKADIADGRESPAQKVVELLEERGAEVVSHDPYLRPGILEKLMMGIDGVILCTMHTAYKGCEELLGSSVVVDTTGKLDVSRLPQMIVLGGSAKGHEE